MKKEKQVENVEKEKKIIPGHVHTHTLIFIFYYRLVMQTKRFLNFVFFLKTFFFISGTICLYV